MQRTDERKQFLTDILTTAIENGGHGWFYVREYRWDPEDGTPLGEAFAVVEPHDEDDKTHRVDLDVVAKGLGVIRSAVLRTPEATPEDGEVLHHAKTGERLYLGREQQQAIMACDRENDAGEIDAIDALAIVECGLFGRVVYA